MPTQLNQDVPPSKMSSGTKGLIRKNVLSNFGHVLGHPITTFRKFKIDHWTPGFYLSPYSHILSNDMEDQKWISIAQSRFKAHSEDKALSTPGNYFDFLSQRLPDLEPSHLAKSLHHDLIGERVIRDSIHESKKKQWLYKGESMRELRDWHNQLSKNIKADLNLFLEMFCGEVIYAVPAMSTRAGGGRRLSGTLVREVAELMNTAIQFKLEDVFFEDGRYWKEIKGGKIEIDADMKRIGFRDKYKYCFDAVTKAAKEVGLRAELHEWAHWSTNLISRTDGKMSKKGSVIEDLPAQEQSFFAVALTLAWSIREMTEDLAILRASILDRSQVLGEGEEARMRQRYAPESEDLKNVRFITRLRKIDALLDQIDDLHWSVEKLSEITGRRVGFQTLNLLRTTKMSAFERFKAGYNHLTETKIGGPLTWLGLGVIGTDVIANILAVLEVFPGQVRDFITDSTYNLLAYGFVSILLEQIPRLSRKLGFTKTKKAIYS